jgi:hypothetical protein
MGLVGLVLIGLTGWAIFVMQVPEHCSYAALQGLDSIGLVSACAGGFVVGHVLGRWFEPARRARELKALRMQIEARPTSLELNDQPDPATVQQLIFTGQAAQPRRALIIHGVLVLVLGLVTSLLVYETIALSATDINWPITYSVRCFVSSNLVAAAVGAAAFCFLLGHLIWYPEESGE